MSWDLESDDSWYRVIWNVPSHAVGLKNLAACHWDQCVRARVWRWKEKGAKRWNGERVIDVAELDGMEGKEGIYRYIKTRLVLSNRSLRKVGREEAFFYDSTRGTSHE